MRSFRLTRYAGEMALHPDVARLAEILEAMTTLLKLHGDNGWAEQVERCRSTIAQSDYHGVDRLLCLYGGMGSLNDVILQSGGVVPTDDNERFDALRTDAWKQANALARDGARGNGCYPSPSRHSRANSRALKSVIRKDEPASEDGKRGKRRDGPQQSDHNGLDLD